MAPVLRARNRPSLVLVEPNGATLPVRFRKDVNDRPIGRTGNRVAEPFTIAVTPLKTPEPGWYTLADVIAAVLLGEKLPKIRRAIRFVPEGRRRPRSAKFRNRVELRSNRPIFKTILEQKQIAKDGSKSNYDLAKLALGLKEMANSGPYGIHAEVNVKPPKSDDPIVGDVYADVSLRPRRSTTSDREPLPIPSWQVRVRAERD